MRKARKSVIAAELIRYSEWRDGVDKRLAEINKSAPRSSLSGLMMFVNGLLLVNMGHAHRH